MAEAGSFAERVKQQADIVRVIGEYVRLKKIRRKFHWSLPLPSGKNSFIRSAPRKTDLSLLRLRRRRRRLQIRNGNGEIAIPRSDSHRRRKVRHRHSQAARTLAGRTPRKSTALGPRRNAPRNRRIFCPRITRQPRRQSRRSVPRRSRPRPRSNETFRPRFRAILWRRAPPLPETKISRKIARRLRPCLSRPKRPRLRPLPPPHHVPHRQ